MAPAPNAGSPAHGPPASAEPEQLGSSARLRVGADQSDIRGLRADSLGEAESFDLGWDQYRHDPVRPPPLEFNDAIARYGESQEKDSGVLPAPVVGDLREAVTKLFHENQRLRQELESSRSEFEELRTVNINIQEEMAEALGIADEQRLELMDDLDRARNDVAALEGELAQTRRTFEDDLAQKQQQVEDLEDEVAELEARLFLDGQDRRASDI
jgi:hypothetical protein